MPAIDLAKAARHSNRPAHARRVEQHSLNLAVQQIKEIEAARKKRRNAMVRIVLSLLAILGAFAIALANHWMTWQQAATVALGLAGVTMLVAEIVSA
jgi:hypothetical protein